MSRHERRSEVARFRKEIAGAHLVTYLVEANTEPGDALLKSALARWLAAVMVRRPTCIGCAASFADSDVPPGGFLYAVSPAVPDVVSVSAICDSCWRVLPDTELDATCTRALRLLLPAGRFERLQSPTLMPSAKSRY